MRDKFGVKICEGKNLETLNNAKIFFMSKGVQIVRYNFTIDSTKERSLKELKTADLKTCHICDRSLYDIVNKGDGEDGVVFARQKKKLIFIDDTGHEYHCCYKLKNCLKKVDFVASGKAPTDLRVPTFTQFSGIDPESDLVVDDRARDVLWSAESSYNKYVVPFVKKWQACPVDKNNVMEFFNDIAGLKRHLLYYDNLEAADTAKNKIFNMIGIRE